MGLATQSFSERYATLSAALLAALAAPGQSAAATEAAGGLVCDWIERNDAQNYVVLGDPAVRLHPGLSTRT